MDHQYESYSVDSHAQTEKLPHTKLSLYRLALDRLQKSLPPKYRKWYGFQSP